MNTPRPLKIVFERWVTGVIYRVFHRCILTVDVLRYLRSLQYDSGI